MRCQRVIKQEHKGTAMSTIRILACAIAWRNGQVGLKQHSLLGKNVQENRNLEREGCAWSCGRPRERRTIEAIVSMFGMALW